ncbi:uncharacterized protein LOC129791306 isoform X2 [Lutzomyia longipalpis]|uniref:uncharacterized protein LOC129791306 isoform X2 n=1 Tax=Lutzomyia longipalpis TaxID=7200 RepID=UPI002483F92A|nr:uncharacterized protein LOC129791306 isoform X2 [Lutzomyia longipalpis]
MAANFPGSSHPKSGKQGSSSRSVRGYPEIPEWFRRSNILQVIQSYLEDQGSVAIDKKKIESYLPYFYNVYMEHPVSRRSPVLKLDQLVFEPPLGTLKDQQICARNNIKEICSVDIQKNNLIFKCERLYYKMLMEKEKGIRRGVDFPSYDSFIENALDISRGKIPRFMEFLQKQDKKRADKAMERRKEDKEDEASRKESDSAASPKASSSKATAGQVRKSTNLPPPRKLRKVTFLQPSSPKKKTMEKEAEGASSKGSTSSNVPSSNSEQIDINENVSENSSPMKEIPKRRKSVKTSQNLAKNFLEDEEDGAKRIAFFLNPENDDEIAAYLLDNIHYSSAEESTSGDEVEDVDALIEKAMQDVDGLEKVMAMHPDLFPESDECDLEIVEPEGPDGPQENTTAVDVFSQNLRSPSASSTPIDSVESLLAFELKNCDVGHERIERHIRKGFGVVRTRCPKLPKTVQPSQNPPPPVSGLQDNLPVREVAQNTSASATNASSSKDDVYATLRNLEEYLGINKGTRATPEVIEIDSETSEDDTEGQFDQHQVKLLRKFLGSEDGALRELLSICEVNEEEVEKCNLDVTDERIANAMGAHVGDTLRQSSDNVLSNVEEAFVDINDLSQSERSHYELSHDPLEGCSQNISNN